MIEILEGTHETINYGNPLGLRLFHNVDYEDYPEHWHTAIEIIMPIHEGYNVIIGSKKYCLKEGDILIINPGVLHGLEAPPTGERIILQFSDYLLYSLKEMETLLIKCASACAIFIRGRRYAEIIQFYKTSDGFHYCGV